MSSGRAAQELSSSCLQGLDADLGERDPQLAIVPIDLALDHVCERQVAHEDFLSPVVHEEFVGDRSVGHGGGVPEPIKGQSSTANALRSLSLLYRN